MTLLELRKLFVKRSGRYDLVSDPYGGDWSDAGADFFIQAGHRFLDRRQDTCKTQAKHYKTIQAGTYSLTFQDCRVIREVWVASFEEEGRTKLIRKDRTWMRQNFGEPYGSLDSGRPSYYSPLILRPHPSDLTADDLGIYLTYADVSFGGDETYNGILFLPPTDGEYQIEVIGDFYTKKLENDDDENFWSIVHPELSIYAAMLQLEMTYRNTEGVKDWLNSIDVLLLDMDKDMASEGGVDRLQMEG